jgi:5-methyltetrahydrofolate--homocysteine methyltransferase
MGTMVQRHRLSEADFRGERFRDHPHDLKGNNDLLVLTRPDVIAGIHREYLEAGADIIETSTFNATSISQADYGLESVVYELNVEGARLARQAADEAMDPARPTSRGSSRARSARRTGRCRSRPTSTTRPSAPSPSTRCATPTRAGPRPARRRRRPAARRDDLRHAQREGRARGHRGGTSTRGARRLPVMISVTITDRSGRTLSGQTVDAFWVSVAHARRSASASTARSARATCGRTSPSSAALATCYTSCYPNAGLPNAFGEYDERRTRPRAAPRVRRGRPRQPRRRLLRDDAGAHRGDRERPSMASRRGTGPTTSPRTRVQRARDRSPSARQQLPDDRRADQRHRLRVRAAHPAGDFTGAVEVALEQVRGGANILDVNMDEGMLDSEQAMTTFLNLIATEPEIARVPIMIDSSKWSVLEAGLKCVQGKAIVNSISLKEGEDDFLEKARRSAATARPSW